ncbi:MAG: hypothetical protein BroJett005_31190 [Ignavibacteriota bacterium]|nr:MAG: hypothetical protein BroJett005_31190 [Ignavibacteriota bacterium]
MKRIKLPEHPGKFGEIISIEENKALCLVFYGDEDDETGRDWFYFNPNTGEILE